MSLRSPRSFLRLLVVLFCLCWPLIAQASYAPLQNVTTWVDGVTARFKIFDPSLGNVVRFVEGSVAGPAAANSITTLTASQGMVYCEYDNYDIALAVYDPGRGLWKTWESSSSPMRSQVIGGGGNFHVIQDGIVLIYCPQANLAALIYDFIQGQWVVGAGLDFSHSTFYSALTKLGVVTCKTPSVHWAPDPWSHQGAMVYGMIYDPSRSSFKQGVIQMTYGGTGDSVSSLAINNNGTITFTFDKNYTWGYNPATGGWYGGEAKPLASFSALPAASGGGYGLPICLWGMLMVTTILVTAP